MSARSYELVCDFIGEDPIQGLVAGQSIDTVSTSPSWVLVVYRYQQAVTFSRVTMTSASASTDQAVVIKGGPLVITSDCTSLQVESNKASFTGGLTAELNFGEVNYLSEILPGDWCAAWITNNEQDATDVVDKINAGGPANGFMDGLKFIGRVSGIRKTIRVDGTGLKTVGYSLQASSFKEFDASLFFDPYLIEEQPGIAQYISKLGKNIADFMTEGQLGVSINKVMPFLMDLLLGSGIPPAVSHAGGITSIGAGANKQSVAPPQTVQGLNSGTAGEAPYSYLIPAEVGRLVGEQASSSPSGILSAADLDEMLFGVQKYGSENAGTTPGQLFTPDGTTTAGNRNYTNKEMLGLFLPDLPDFSDKSVWTILNQYLNPIINEMYTTLRVNPSNAVVPTLVIRQMPFTTELLDPYLTKQGITLTTTHFLELPRWNIHPLLVMNASVGRSDSMRYNFIHVYGQSETAKISNPITFQIVRNPPISDDNDAKRSGLRTLMTTVNVLEKDTEGHAAQKWMLLTADSHMGMHLVFSGTINMFGIQAPICIGDNAEFDGVVYHIESVLHSASISPIGQKTFFTTLQLSHGLRSDNDMQGITTNTDINIFPGMYQSDDSDLDPGLTYEAHNPAPDQSGLRALQAPVDPNNGTADTNTGPAMEAAGTFTPSSQATPTILSNATLVGTGGNNSGGSN